MLKIFSIFFFTFISSTPACEVVGPAKIVYSTASNQSSGLRSLSFKACSEDQIKSIHSSLSDFEGVLRGRTLEAEIPGSKISIPKPIEIKSLSSLVNEKIELPKGWKLIEAQVVGSQQKNLNLQKNSIVTIECQSCNNTGVKNLKLEAYDPISARKDVTWIKASVAVKTEVLSATSALPINHKGLSPSSVKKATIYSISPEAYFTNQSQLVFYKLNKGMKQGQPIKFTDLSALNLVRPGQPVRINMNSGVIKLNGSATPMRAGRLGEVIQLKTINSKKIIIGRITNFNEVEVEL